MTRRKLILTAVVVLMFLGANYGAVSYTSRDDFCSNCHPVLVSDFLKTMHSKPQNQDSKRAGCIDCHAEPGLMSMMYVKIKGLRDLEETMMLSPDEHKTPRPAEVRDVVCGECHEDIITTMHASALDNETGDIKQGILPKGTRLSRIGLNMNGKLHLDSDFKAKCAVCHDHSVNFLKEDPMSCTSCHWNVAHNHTTTNRFTGSRSYLRDYERNIPAMIQVCGRCHNGKTHGNGQWPSPEARKSYGRDVMADVFMYERIKAALEAFERENGGVPREKLAAMILEKQPGLADSVKANCSGCHANLWDWETAKREQRKGFRLDRYFTPGGE